MICLEHCIPRIICLQDGFCVGSSSTPLACCLFIWLSTLLWQCKLIVTWLMTNRGVVREIEKRHKGNRYSHLHGLSNGNLCSKRNRYIAFPRCLWDEFWWLQLLLCAGARPDPLLLDMYAGATRASTDGLLWEPLLFLLPEKVAQELAQLPSVQGEEL